MPILRASPEDFVVDEIPLYPALGEGEHTFVRVEKRGRTTEEIARALARAAGISPREIGYAGRKDRDAVTRQWLSVPSLDPARALDLVLDGARVLEALRHRHRLRVGDLRGNRFEIVVREVDAAAAAHAEARLAELVAHGMSNRFGAQRFGRDGTNADAGRAILTGERRANDRRAARFLVSALQSAVFNEALRLRSLPLDRLEAGDVAMRHESGGCFVVEDAAREQPRADAFELSATGPIFGSKVLAPCGAPAERERAALAACGLDPDATLRPPPGLRLRGARRPLRVRPEAVSLTREPDLVRLAFTLPAGCFASVLCEELFPDLAPPESR